MNPRYASVVFNKVYQISYVVDVERVIVELSKIVSARPNSAHVVFMRGFFVSAKCEFKRVDRETLERGIADYGRALELNPNFSTACVYRGDLWTRLAQREDDDDDARAVSEERARADLARGLELDPKSGVGHFLFARWWSSRSTPADLPKAERAARQQSAIESLEAAFDAGFKGTERLKNDKGFDPIRGLPGFRALLRGR